MKLSIRIAILLSIMSILAFTIYHVTIDIVLPWLMSSNDGIVLSFGLIIGIMMVLIVWVGVGEFFGKLLKCDEIVDKFINDK